MEEPVGYLFRTALNLNRKRLRRLAVELRHFGRGEAEIGGELDLAESRTDARRMLDSLPRDQRAALILRDVLHFSAAETAALLDTSPAAVNSALQRARETLDRHRPSPADPYDPADPTQRALLDRYVAAFEAHDVRALTDVLRDDATTSMPPFGWWVQGGPRIAALVALGGCEGARLVPTDINGSPGFGQYRPDDGALRPFALVLVQTREGRIADSVTFLGSAARFAEFGLPEVVAADR